MATTFPRLLQKHASERPTDPALREKEYGIWQTWNWQRAAQDVRAMASGLAPNSWKSTGRSAGSKESISIVLAFPKRIPSEDTISVYTMAAP